MLRTYFCMQRFSPDILFDTVLHANFELAAKKHHDDAQTLCVNSCEVKETVDVWPIKSASYMLNQFALLCRR